MEKQGRRANPPAEPTDRQTDGPSFLDYLRDTSPKSWTLPRHVRLIAEHLEAVERGEITRLAIHMPPRHGKSESATIRGAAWGFERHPDQNVLLTAATQRLANRFSKKARAITAARRLSPDSKAADEWTLPEGGSFVARGVGNPPTGIGFRRIHIDDPIRRREDAESEVYREKTWDWYTDDLFTRLEPGGAIVMTATLWHEDDVLSRAVAAEPGKWTVLKLSALSEEPYPDWDWRRQPGMALWPERYDVPDLLAIRSVMVANEGEYSWRALYQQQPTAREGSFFEQTRLAVGDPPEILRASRGWDLAATKDGGDWTAGVKVGQDTDGRFWILDIKRERFDVDQRDRLIVQTAGVDGAKVRVRLPQDPGQAGKGESVRMLRMMAGYPVRVLPVTGAKEVRAAGVSAQVNGGNVSIARDCPHMAAFLEELRTFPNGRTDDMVDALADAFTEVTQKRVVTAGAA
ncbi:MAG: phage terminase large subunit [Gemmatimonadetes bacterium]|nr:phage terminase large subunit [Gemmatimonadota bacterium]